MPVEQAAVIALPDEVGEPGLALEGIFISGRRPGGSVIAAPHPLYGGRLENPVVTEIALRLESVQLASLRFNWRGVAASAGEVSGENDIADQDYGAALAFLEESVTGPISACGYSFGSAAAVRAAASSERISRLILVAPPPALLDADALARFDGPVFMAVGDRDEFAPLAQVEELASKLENATLEVLVGSDHFFATGTGELGRALERWL
jgi:alpha/beta superfamily hydrolase